MKKKSFFGRILYIIFFPLLLIEKGLIYLYKFLISPLLPHTCKYVPTCSTYFLQSIEEYGIIRGSFSGIKRIFSCNPFKKGGYDPVIPNIKGKIKWIL